MRKWIIGGGLLFLLCLALALLNIDFLIANNKNYLLDQAQRMLGRKIAVGEIRVSLLSGIGIHLNNLALSDDPAYSSSDFLKSKDVQVNLAFLPLLLQRVRIKRMMLHDPVISIIRNEAGSYNFSTLGSPAKSGRKKEIENRDKTTKDLEGKHLSPALLVPFVDITNGTLRYQDLRDSSDLTVTQVDLKVADFAIDAPFTVELAVALFAAKQNVKLKTSLGPVGADNNLRDVPFDGRIEAQELDLGKIRSAAPNLKKALPKALDFRGIYTIKDLRFKGTLKHPSLKGAIEGTDASVRFD
ncbi:MAG: AsmA family protein [Candidatus Binatia bacterium]